MSNSTVPAWFDASAYFQNKLASLGEGWTENALNSALLGAGYSLDDQGLYRHFVDFGNSEGISPNTLFNTQQYLRNKAAHFFHVSNPTNEQIAEIASLISAAGMTAWTHYANHGWMEGINPSDDFDANQYFIDKIVQLGDGWTWDTMIQAFVDSRLSPLAHYYACGIGEGLSATPVSSDIPNAMPVISGIPDALQRIYFDYPTWLADFTVSDAENGILIVTLEAINGTIHGAVDEYPDAPGIQISGFSSDINATLKNLFFTPTEQGNASIIVYATDGTTTISDTYDMFTPYVTTLELGAKEHAKVIGGSNFDYNFTLQTTGWGDTLDSFIHPGILDAEKNGINGDRDDGMCWAAVAANMLAWSGWAQQSSLAISEGNTVEDAVFDVFINNFTLGHDAGGNTYYGLKWFFDGTYLPAGMDMTGWDQPVQGSGNYLGIDALPFIGYFPADDISAETAYDFLDQAFSAGLVLGLDIGWYDTVAQMSKPDTVDYAGHVVTCWGYTYNPSLKVTNTKYLTGLIVTDSDDDQTANRAEAPDRLFILDLKWDSRSKSYYTDSYDDIIGRIEGFHLIGFNSELYEVYDESYYAYSEVEIVGSTTSEDFFDTIAV